MIFEMIGLQDMIVAAMVLAAFGYIGRAFFLKSRTFSPRPGCKADCGCSDSGKRTTAI